MLAFLTCLRKPGPDSSASSSSCLRAARTLHAIALALHLLCNVSNLTRVFTNDYLETPAAAARPRMGPGRILFSKRTGNDGR